ncbi:MAG: hypothetical protein NC830_01130 [Candidatus Omnitrophica bacterium]|nr:hypothetical protein [Candidatus Omnitrophota bacterium]
MTYLGIDENGYGPALGPLVVSGIKATSDITEKRPDGICDSKILFSSQNKLAKIEKIALAIFKICRQKLPENALDIFENFENVHCPEINPAICFESLPKIPLWTTGSDAEKYVEYLSEFLTQHRIKIESVNSQILCVNKFNNFCRKNMKKDFINYMLFEKIMLQFSLDCDDLIITAGKIGGRKRYICFLRNGFCEWEIIKEKEDKEVSTYLLTKNKKKIILNFVKDIESKSFLGTLAGIYGKYIRELFMTGINSWLKTERTISGYRDRYTSEFIKKLCRKNLRYMDCILRIK